MEIYSVFTKTGLDLHWNDPNQVSDLPANPTPIYANFPPVVQINGQDLSKSSHEDAVEAFRTAKEPIVVEVLRRVHKNQTNAVMHPQPPSPPSPTMVTVSTQTDEYIDDPIYWDIPWDPPPPASPPFYANGNLMQPSSRQPLAFSADMDDVGLTDLEVSNTVDYEDNLDDDRVYDMEYEEVSLNKLETQGKIGLTLCYGSADEDFTDIFVSEIEPHSIAAGDGRIHEGDQILQINGVDVHSREQAIRLFGEVESEITLLLARPHAIQMDDGFMEEHSLLNDLHLDMLEQHHHRNMEFTSNLLSHGNDEEGGTTDTGTTENSSNKHEKDSGVGRTDESTKNEESSEQEIMENECLSPDSSTKYPGKLGSGELRQSNDSFTSNEAHDQEQQANEISAEECDKFREVLEHRYSSVDNSPARGMVRKDSQSSIEREIAALNKEMEQIQLECEEIVEAHARQRVPAPNEVVLRTEPYRSPRMVPRMGTRLDYLKQVQSLQDPNQMDPVWVRQEHLAKFMKDSMKPREVIRLGKEEHHKETSSSGFNTSDSGQSAQLTLELSQNGDQQTLSLSGKSGPSDKSMKDPVNGEAKKRGVTKSQSSSSFSEKTSQTLPEDRSESLQDLYAQYADVMYTNRANLEHTIMVQQKLFQQQLSHRNRHRDNTKSEPPVEASPVNPPPAVAPSSSSSGQQQMEWVVKRRADGSRYITRRPVRNKMLKERARKVAEERSGMTTDDDAVSELKVGRYWSKEDRKRHLEKARDYKKRKEMMKQKMETLKENEEVKKEPNIVELSHRKMMKHKGKKVFDDFTTVQEMLAHGSREGQGKAYNPLLSVTTV